MIYGETSRSCSLAWPRVGARARAREDSDNVEPVKRELEQPVRSAINRGYWIYKQLLRTSVMSVRRCRNIFVRLLLSSYPSVESAALQSATYRHVANFVEISLKRRNEKERRFLPTKSSKITNLTTRWYLRIATNDIYTVDAVKNNLKKKENFQACR